MKHVESSILTNSGIYFDLLNPRPSQVNLLDIAVGLSNLCRYTGQVSAYYSVAQHSVLASHLVEPQHAMHALLHDAAEAYVGDVSRPLKRLLPNYQRIEAAVQSAVWAAFGLPEPIPEQVHIVDRFLLAWERRDLLNEHAAEWAATAGVEVPESVPPLRPLRPEAALEQFLDRYNELLQDATEARAA